MERDVAKASVNGAMGHIMKESGNMGLGMEKAFSTLVMEPSTMECGSMISDTELESCFTPKVATESRAPGKMIDLMVRQPFSTEASPKLKQFSKWTSLSLKMNKVE